MNEPVHPSHAELDSLRKNAEELAEISRGVIRNAPSFSTSIKSDSSVVTEVDLATERRLREEISRRFPQHGIQGEEFPAINAHSPYQWVLDPIDGTVSFTHHIPLYGTIIALYFKGAPVVGVIDHPALGIRTSAARGLGTFCNGARITLADVAPDQPIEREVIATTRRSNFSKAGLEREFMALQLAHPDVRGYTDCFGHTLAIRGQVGAMIDAHLQLWDIAATTLLIEEAGGKSELLKAERQPDGATRYTLIWGKPRVVDWLRAQIFKAA